MTFVAPLFLLGLAGLSLPWLLHRFSHQPPEESAFPSSRFLEPVPPPVSRRKSLRYRTLLLLRLAALLALCLLFARPFCAADPAVGASSALTVIAIDRSFSMRAGERMDDAIAAALETIDALGDDDPVQLLSFPAGRADGRAAGTLRASDEPAPAGAAYDSGNHDGFGATRANLDKASARVAVKAVQAGYSGADYGALMQRLEAVVADSELPVQAVVITDGQRRNLPPRLNALYAPGLQDFRVIDVGRSQEHNASVSATASRVDGAFARVTVTVALADTAGSSTDDAAASAESASIPAATDESGAVAMPAALRQQTVTVKYEDRELDSKRIDLVPGESVSVIFERLTLPPVGNPLLSVAIDGVDALEQDNVVSVVVRESDALQVSLLPSPAAADSAAVFLTTALQIDGGSQVTPVNARVAATDIDARHLIEFGSFLTGTVDHATMSFVEAGGNALVVRNSGEQADAGDVTGQGVGRVDVAHPLALGEIDWFNVRFYDAAPMPVETGDQVLLATTSGVPLLLERPTPGGKLLLLNDPLDGVASNLPLQPAFVALMTSMLQWFEANAALPEHVIVNEPVLLPANIQVLDPRGKALRPLTGTGIAESFSFEEPGLHVAVGPHGEHPFQVSLDPLESDISRLDQQELTAWQERNTAAAGYENDDDVATAPEGAAVRNIEMNPADSSIVQEVMGDGSPPVRVEGPRWFWLLPLMAVLWLAEALMANRRLDVRRDGS